MKKGKNLNLHIYNVVESTNEATDISECVVKAILKEGGSSLSTKRHVSFSMSKRKQNGEREYYSNCHQTASFPLHRMVLSQQYSTASFTML
jgi:hypothetical protein